MCDDIFLDDVIAIRFNVYFLYMFVLLYSAWNVGRCVADTIMPVT